MEVLIFYADKLMVISNSKNLHVFICAILLKSQKFAARRIYMCYSMLTMGCRRKWQKLRPKLY